MLQSGFTGPGKMKSKDENRKMVFEKIQSFLTQSKVNFRLHHHDPVVTVDQAEAIVPHLTVNLIKTIVFKIKSGPWILAGVSGVDRIHYKYLADIFGVNRKLIRAVSAPDVETGLGFEIGGVGPFPVASDVAVVLDQSLMDLTHVFCGSGRNTVTIEISPGDLAVAGLARIAAIRKP
nr:YbaK/EbsC family protein [uncultured Desulfobacter sp.]